MPFTSSNEVVKTVVSAVLKEKKPDELVSLFMNNGRQELSKRVMDFYNQEKNTLPQSNRLGEEFVHHVNEATKLVWDRFIHSIEPELLNPSVKEHNTLLALRKMSIENQLLSQENASLKGKMEADEEKNKLLVTHLRSQIDTLAADNNHFREELASLNRLSVAMRDKNVREDRRLSEASKDNLKQARIGYIALTKNKKTYQEAIAKKRTAYTEAMRALCTQLADYPGYKLTALLSIVGLAVILIAAPLALTPFFLPLIITGTGLGVLGVVVGGILQYVSNNKVSRLANAYQETKKELEENISNLATIQQKLDALFELILKTPEDEFEQTFYGNPLHHSRSISIDHSCEPDFRSEHNNASSLEPITPTKSYLASSALLSPI